MRTYRASSLGSCLRSQIALQLGMAQVATPDRMEDLYQRGRDHEVECLAAMWRDGWYFESPEGFSGALYEDDGQIGLTLEVAGAQITGHLDGMGYRPETDTNPVVVEIKSPASWHKWEAAHKTGDYTDPLMHRYAWQISVYMAATGLEAVIACVEDGQVRTFGIEVAPHSFNEIANRIESMELAVESGDDVTKMVCSQADYPCPVAYLHDRPEIIDDPALSDLISAYGSTKALRDRYDQQMKRYRDEIDAHLGLSDSLTTASGTVTRVPAGTVTDWKATAEYLADVAGLDLGYVAKKKPRAGYVNVTPKATTDE